MKALKLFLPSLYSEYLLHASPSSGEPGALVDTSGAEEGDLRGPGGEGRGSYERGLGETFGFPGDARKMRERSKMKLWKEYFVVHGRNMTRETPNPDSADNSPSLSPLSEASPGRPAITAARRAVGGHERVHLPPLRQPQNVPVAARGERGQELAEHRRD